jgi:ABC-type multidrug transport system ATPase subunit
MPRWSTTTALRRFAILAGVPGNDVHARADAMIEQLGLEEHREKSIKALSKGNLQRLGLAQALLRDQDVYVFDEPTHGLDPLWTQRFRDLIIGLRRPGRTILIASHNLDELQRLADRVVIMDHGRLQRLVMTGYEPSTSGAVTYRLHAIAGSEHVRNVFGQAVDTGKGEFDVVVADLTELNRGVAELIARGTVLASVTPAHSVLEEQFRQAVTGGNA